jgi:hypothetical protein
MSKTWVRTAKIALPLSRQLSDPTALPEEDLRTSLFGLANSSLMGKYSLIVGPAAKYCPT